MRHILTLLLFLFVLGTAHAQAPQGIPYQAAARNSSGAVLSSTSISVRFTIRDNTSTGIILYQETHSTTTNSNGMFSVNIGQGTPVIGTFASINWGSNAKFMQVELAPAGGSSYIDMGTQQMMSVPYALYAETTMHTSGSAGSFSHYVGEKWGGGVVFNVFRGSDGQEHGLIVAKADQSSGIDWSNIASTGIGSSAQSSWNGLNNCIAIVSQPGHATSAAKLCLDLVDSGYDDWYLPSRNELNLIYCTLYNINRSLGEIEGATELSIASSYWSSSEIGSSLAWNLYLSNGTSTNGANKSNSNRVRAIRSF